MDIGKNYAHLYACNRNDTQKKIYKTNDIRTRKVQKPQNSLDGFLRPGESEPGPNPHIILLRRSQKRSFGPGDPQRYIYTQKQKQELYRKQYIAQQKQVIDGVRRAYYQESSHLDRDSGADKTVGDSVQLKVYERIQNTYNAFAAYRKSLGSEFYAHFSFTLSPTRLWQVSLTGAMIFGMISMSLIYRNLGQNVLAKEDVEKTIIAESESRVEKVIDSSDEEREEKLEKKKDADENKESADKESEKEINTSIDSASEKKDEQKDEKELDGKDVEKETNVKKQEKTEKSDKNKRVKSIDSASEKKDEQKEKKAPKESTSLQDLAYETVEGYPIEKMLPYILDQDPEVAKYLIAIAKQESAWGKRVPVLNGQDCYNYWGYRGTRKLMGSGGHTCFNSRKDAVETVGKRLKELIYEYDRKTANRLIVWKCGSSCAGHSQEGVDRWIGVVDTYYSKLSQK